MPRTPNMHGGGALTNANGLHFEQTTSLNDILLQHGFDVSSNGEVLYNGSLIGYSKAKKDFNRFLVDNGVDLNVNSNRLEPDDTFINIINRTVYILEKKFQRVGGSVDEKLQTCPFKKRYYENLDSQMGYETCYTYILNEWFTQPKYRDVLRFILDEGCYYFFNDIPLQFLGL